MKKVFQIKSSKNIDCIEYLYQQEIQDAANIITEDRLIMERLLDKWRDLLKNRG